MHSWGFRWASLSTYSQAYIWADNCASMTQGLLSKSSQVSYQGELNPRPKIFSLTQMGPGKIVPLKFVTVSVTDSYEIWVLKITAVSLTHPRKWTPHSLSFIRPVWRRRHFLLGTVSQWGNQVLSDITKLSALALKVQPCGECDSQGLLLNTFYTLWNPWTLDPIL